MHKGFLIATTIHLRFKIPRRLPSPRDGFCQGAKVRQAMSSHLHSKEPATFAPGPPPPPPLRARTTEGPPESWIYPYHTSAGRSQVPVLNQGGGTQIPHPSPLHYYALVDCDGGRIQGLVRRRKIWSWNWINPHSSCVLKVLLNNYR